MSHITYKDYMYQPFVISDINVVELLIEFRYKYDDNLFLENGSMFYITGAKALNQEIVATYASLDETIKKCKFNNQQLTLIKLVELGYTYREISRATGIEISNIKKALRTLYKAIVKENERQWRKVTYVKELGLKTKPCSKCEEELPATNEFFSDNNYSKDGLHSICKKCR